MARKETIHSKLDKIYSRIYSIDITIAKQEVTLQDHVRRSLANEKGLDTLKTELRPIYEHIATVTFCAKAMMWLLGSGVIVFIVRTYLGL